MNKNNVLILSILIVFGLTVLIGSVSANENVTDVISTEKDIDEISINEEKYGEIVQEFEETVDIDDNSYSSNPVLGSWVIIKPGTNIIYVEGPSSVEKGKIANYTFNLINYRNRIVNISFVDNNGKICYNFPNFKFTDKSVEFNLNTSNLKAGIYNIKFFATNFNDSCTYQEKTLQIIDTKFSKSTSAETISTKKLTATAPSVTAYYKAKKYFKVTVKKGGKAVKDLKLKVKVYSGKKYKTYTIKTNKNGVAQLSTKKFKVGSHKVKITSKNSNYKISKTSKIVIKKKNIKKKISYMTFHDYGWTYKVSTKNWKIIKQQAKKSYGGRGVGYSSKHVKVTLYKPGYSSFKSTLYCRYDAYGAQPYLSNAPWK